ncbi:hypothetical protein [Amycolatopsis anabasis]|nr:hypothetical protein [Amycolatopsis anabasis]
MASRVWAWLWKSRPKNSCARVRASSKIMASSRLTADAASAPTSMPT